MKTYSSKKGNVTIQCYYYNHKYCMKVIHGEVILVGQYPTKDYANKEFIHAKELYPDLVRTK